MIGKDIEICVVDIRGDKVRIGIDAPKEIAVHRKEVYSAIMANDDPEFQKIDRDPNRGRLRSKLIDVVAKINAKLSIHRKEAELGMPGDMDQLRHSIRANVYEELSTLLSAIISA